MKKSPHISGQPMNQISNFAKRRSFPITKSENTTLDKINRRLTVIDNNRINEFVRKDIGKGDDDNNNDDDDDDDNDDDDGNNNDNVVTTTTNDIIIDDRRVIVSANSLEEIRLLINGRCSTV
ncbi:hypothetical protein LOAG_13672 [Loa loa]|uniref:Uncharacterized protein n=2 Tax=Loa loa TaxID=7209 RepID=A0A1S0TJ42_LOALO|nr:hypothetical protein LOAG_13672 [Loa loa]EFO14845.2 hypothetical protein LOAG_13672 [Loa loa]